MKAVLVDSNVLLDVLTEDRTWYDWSSDQISALADERVLVINPIVYAEVSIGFDRIEDLDEAVLSEHFRREPLPYEAAFLAGKVFLQYRRRGGTRVRPLPDFFIGAHAAIQDLVLLTRDAARYRTYFPTVELIAP
ncbi:MAG: type II toxin-antitoxin system VapC family toxin [Longimicrobiales bacterium]